MERAVLLAQRVREESGVFPERVGIGAGGQIDPIAGDVVHATELLPGWTGQPLAATFADVFQVPAFADNDVNALAEGELRHGAGRGCRSLVFLALGTGVGGAIVVDGKVLHGARGAGGELGHLLLYPPDRNLEACASGEGIRRAYQLASGSRTGLSSEEIAERAASGDPAACEAAEIVGRDLGYALVTLAHLFAPERIVIGGGVVDGFGERVLGPAREQVRMRCLPGVSGTPVLAAELGRDAAVVGAASVAVRATG
jgi:glucokinase